MKVNEPSNWPQKEEEEEVRLHLTTNCKFEFKFNTVKYSTVSCLFFRHCPQ